MKVFAAFAFASALSLTAAAQSTTPTPGKNDYNVNQRRADQRARIHQGVESGQLTRGEQHHLNTQEHGIHQEEKGMRAQDNGKLTGQDRQTLHHQQNQESRRIYRDKHNAKVGAPR